MILNYQMVTLKKIELRCLKDVLFSVMSMGKERSKSPTLSNFRFEVCFLAESKPFFFFFIHSHEKTNTFNTTVYSSAKVKIVIFLILFT